MNGGREVPQTKLMNGSREVRKQKLMNSSREVLQTKVNEWQLRSTTNKS